MSRSTTKASQAQAQQSDPTPPAPETEPTAASTEAVVGSPSTTTLDSHLDAPSVTAPGDAPADTTDPTERASSATPDKATAAAAGHGTVNAVVKVGEGAVDPVESKGRTETYEAFKPDGTKVTVIHDLDTGSTRVDASGQDSDQAPVEA